MEKWTIYYDDTNENSKRYAEKLRRAPHLECKRASSYKNTKIIYEPNQKVGFLFHSENGKLSYDMNHIIWRIIMDKNSHIFLWVADGSREMKAVKSAVDTLTPRGYKISNVYTKYLFEKYHVSDPIERVLEDMEQETARFSEHMEEMKSLNKKDMRKRIKEHMKAYRKYKKNL